MPTRPAGVKGFESDTLSSLCRAGHDIGLGAVIGGNCSRGWPCIRRSRRSATSVGAERCSTVVASLWTVNWWPRAVVGGVGGARADEARPGALSGRERGLAGQGRGGGWVAATGIAAAAQGMRLPARSPMARPSRDGRSHLSRRVSHGRAPQAENQQDRQRPSRLGSRPCRHQRALSQAGFRRPAVRRFAPALRIARPAVRRCESLIRCFQLLVVGIRASRGGPAGAGARCERTRSCSYFRGAVPRSYAA